MENSQFAEVGSRPAQSEFVPGVQGCFSPTSFFGFTNFSGLRWLERRDKVCFVNRAEKLCNQLHRSVPDLAARAVGQFYRAQSYTGHCDFSHAGGRDALDAMERELDRQDLRKARAVLRRYGYLSSPPVFFALEQALSTESEPARYWLCAFEAGFAAHACALETDAG